MDLCLYNRLVTIGRTSLYHGILSFNSRISRPTQQFSQCTFRRSIFMLSYDTNLIFDVGFQMSFSAVTAILLFYTKLNIGGNSPYFIVRWLSSCVAVSIAAQIGALPIAVYYFHTIPLLFLIGNIFVLPLLPVVFGLSFLLLLFSALHIPYDWLGNTVDFYCNIYNR